MVFGIILAVAIVAVALVGAVVRVGARTSPSSSQGIGAAGRVLRR
jgi:hypothetical protein